MIRQLLQLFEEVVRNRLANDVAAAKAAGSQKPPDKWAVSQHRGAKVLEQTTVRLLSSPTGSKDIAGQCVGRNEVVKNALKSRSIYLTEKCIDSGQFLTAHSWHMQMQEVAIAPLHRCTVSTRCSNPSRKPTEPSAWWIRHSLVGNGHRTADSDRQARHSSFFACCEWETIHLLNCT